MSKKWNPIFTCYGLFWDRELVDWRGAQGRSRQYPRLGGTLLGNKKRRTVDIADQIGVYVLYSERYEPVYAGQVGRSKGRSALTSTGNSTLFGRLKQHTGSGISGRWRFFSWYGLKKINKNGTLRKFDKRLVTAAQIIDALEAVMVASFEPSLNSQSGNLSGSDRLLQQPDPVRQGGRLESRIEEIGNKVERLLLIQQGKS